MGKQAASAPAAPDPKATAAAQTGSNVQTAIANTIMGNANETSPYGSVRYNQIGTQRIGAPAGQSVAPGGGTGGYGGKMGEAFGMGGGGVGAGGGEGYDIPQYERVVTLSPEQQKLYNQQTRLGSDLNNLAIGQTGRLNDTLSKPISFDGLPKVPTDFSADRLRVEEALNSRLNPQIERDRNALETKLVNQGLARGSSAFNEEMDSVNRQATDQRMQSVLAGGQEQSRLYGISSDARNRGVQEMLALRNQPINEISALMSGGQVTAPQFQQYQGGSVAPTDIAGMTYNSAALNNQNYQTQQSQNNAAMGGMFGLGQAALMGGMKYGLPLLMGSDRRLKHFIRETGVKLANGLKIYAYRYLWDDIDRVGVMADDVEKVMPKAVHEIGGFKAVNYSMVMGDA